jgi:hypothetical protein
MEMKLNGTPQRLVYVAYVNLLAKIHILERKTQKLYYPLARLAWKQIMKKKLSVCSRHINKMEEKYHNTKIG